MQEISLQKLIESGAHFGHQVRRWNPRMEPYLFGEKDGVHVFDLIKTKPLLEEALQVLKKAASENKRILLVGTKKQAKEKVMIVAKEAGVFYITERWLGGILTNFQQIYKSSQKLTEMKKTMASGGYDKFTKKERLLLEREIERLERFFGGIEELKEPPELLFIVDIKREKGAVREADVRGVETIGIVDSNSDPNLVDYPIPMNDDATRAIDYVLDLVKEAILEGKGIGSKKSVVSSKKEEVKKSGKKK